MPPKKWSDLNQSEQKEALLKLTKRDIGDGPGRWNLAALISRIANAKLEQDPDIASHFVEEEIKLPPTYGSTSSKEKP